MKVWLLSILLFVFSLGAELPSSFKKCNRNDINFNECLAIAIQDAIHQLKEPFEAVGLPSLEPVYVSSSFAVPAEKNNAISFQQNFTDYKIYELTIITVSEANMDFATKTLTIECAFPHITYTANCSFAGKIGAVPISASGPGFMYMDNATFTLTFMFEEYTKGGEHYYKVVDTKMDWDADFISYYFENNDHLNRVINAQRRVVFDVIEHNYRPIFGRAFARIFNGLLENVSISKLFDN